MAEAKKKQKNPLGLWIGGAMIVFGLFAVGSGISSLLDNKTRLLTPKGYISVEVADEPEERAKGLSDREYLDKNEGMLFVFDQTSTENCFWMKDTLIPLDMIWLDENKIVVTVEQNITPDTFPTSFCPEQPAAFGLEINAGRAQELDISPGSELRF